MHKRQLDARCYGDMRALFMPPEDKVLGLVLPVLEVLSRSSSRDRKFAQNPAEAPNSHWEFGWPRTHRPGQAIHSPAKAFASPFEGSTPNLPRR